MSALVIAVAPASAWFQSANGTTTTGIGSTGAISFGDEIAKVECASTEGGWQIHELTKQAAAGLGQHQLISVSKWKECSGFTFNGAEVKPCQFQEIQVSKGQTVGVSISVITECVVTVPGNCEVKIPVLGNQNMTSVGLMNSGTNLVSALSVSRITSTATDLGGFGCVALFNLKNEVGTLKGTFTGKELKEV